MNNELSVLSWNINSLNKRFVDVQQYALQYDIDILCLQETLVQDDFNPRFGPYKRYILEKNDNNRGLIIYVKNTIATQIIDTSFGDNVETIGIKVFLENYTLNVINIYVPQGELNTNLFPDFIYEEPTLLVGDLNARHNELGSLGNYCNENGRRWYHYINNCEDIRVMGEKEPTHGKGGRLDYISLYKDPYRRCLVELVDTLISDHFALKAVIDVSKRQFSRGRKRLNLPKDKRTSFIKSMGGWYKNYEAKNDISFEMSEAGQLKFVNDMQIQIEHLLTQPKTGNKKVLKHNSNRDNFEKWYKDDYEVQYYGKLMRIASRRWRKNHSEDNYKAVQFMAEEYRKVKMIARENYWINFIGNIHHATPSTKVWQRINIARGARNQEAAHENPQRKAEELVEKWAYASSMSSLPGRVRNKLEQKSSYRNYAINSATSMEDDSCVEITEEEIMQSMKKGKSTAPGEDGITYDILSALLMVEGNPLLKLFNIIYKSGKIPHHWKKVIIVPIPKPGDPGNFRPISLASCLCKMTERIILNRLLTKIGGSLHPNLNGFIKGRSTSSCITSYLANTSAKYSVFLDLKSAFDKANRQIILFELVKMGVKGKLLKWIKDYLTGRSAYVLFQGKKSSVKDFELGTPQGGVLSPTLFNVLINVIVSTKVAEGTIIIAYADDILIQSTTYANMQKALNIIGRLCDELGFIISAEKTKAMTVKKGDTEKLILQGCQLEYVDIYKYLGVYVGGNRGRDMMLQYLITSCKTRLRPLKAMAFGCKGTSVAVLRQMYIAYIRSVIDYAAPALICLPNSKLAKLETIQNEAMRIILGCPITASVSNMQVELGLIPLSERIREINTMIGVKALRDDRDTIPKMELLNALGTEQVDGRKWISITAKDIIHYNIIDCGLASKVQGQALPPWECQSANIVIDRPPYKKSDMAPYELKPKYQAAIEESIKSEDYTDQLYCDGSLSNETGRAGAAVTLMNEGHFDPRFDTMVRLQDWSSSTQAELMAILLALKHINRRCNNALIISDSISALQSLKNSKDSSNEKLVNEIKRKLKKAYLKDIKVKFIWVPSHVGIPGNERADTLAKEAAVKDTVDYNLGLSLKQIKTRIREMQTVELSRRRQLEQVSSRSIEYYNKVAKEATYTYGKKGNSRYKELVNARIRLGYRYTWQVMGATDDNPSHCKICSENDGHNLHHYIMACPHLQEYRNNGIRVLEEQVLHFLSGGVIDRILKKHKNFALPK